MWHQVVRAMETSRFNGLNAALSRTLHAVSSAPEVEVREGCVEAAVYSSEGPQVFKLLCRTLEA